MPIKVLAPDIASRIAAGEVIERPASVVKELVENSLDAGANQIAVEVRGGGADLIKVSDNGAGIPPSEVELAFRRYATSKIGNLADLETISSLGFRGEALPSIAAVAEVEISTQMTSEAVGCYMHMVNGEVVRNESCARASGTTITVHHLFRYLPARLKFLKSVNRENSHIAHVVSHYALAFPEVRFSLFFDKRPSLNTTGNNNMRDAVNEVYGLEVAKKVLEVENKDTPIKVSGLVSPPSLTRSNRSYLCFFVNRRWVHSPLLVQATEAAYHGLLMDGKHPIAIINISLPTQEVDANVHPAKTQVKFFHEQVVFSSVERAIKETLTQTPIARPKDTTFADTPWQWQKPQMISDNEPTFITTPLPAMELPILRMLGQIASTYIIAEGPEGLYVIDQHAAHERILYERVLAQWAKQEVEVQGLLQPITIELSPGEEEILKANGELLIQFGFALEPFGDRSYLIRAVPTIMMKSNISEALNMLLADLASKENPTPWEEKIAQSLACHSAIRAGQQLSSEEMVELIRRLDQTHQPRTCPHGRPTMIQLSLHQLEKEFGRLG